MRHVAKNTLKILEAHDLHATKKYGQNFLMDENIIEKMIRLGQINAQTCVVEIGPGIGSLTEALAHHAKKVYAFEIDERLRPVLEDTVGEYEQVQIIFQDFMTIDINDYLSDEENEIVLMANLPYYLTSDIIAKVLLHQDQINRIIVMVQKEVAQKLCGDEKSVLKTLIDYSGGVKTLMNVPRQVFMPAPHVDSAVIEILKDRIMDEALYGLLEAGYKAKRKTLYNNLKPLFHDQCESLLKACDIPLSTRAHELTLEKWVQLNQEAQSL